jgi:hypothetical protein
MTKAKQSGAFKGYRFPPEIISYAVWAYFRFPMSFRDVEDILYKRGGLSVMKQSGHGLENLATNMPKPYAVTGLYHRISGILTR